MLLKTAKMHPYAISLLTCLCTLIAGTAFAENAIKIAPIQPYEPETEVIDTGTDENATTDALLLEYEDESGEKVYERVDKKPGLLNQNFTYPDELKALGIEGRVVTRFIVSSTGAVEKIRIVTSPDERLSDLTRETVSQWRFRPGEREGKPVNTVVTVPLMYKLSEEERQAMIPPKRLVNATPEYPVELLNEHPSGTVQLGFEIAPNGLAFNIQVLSSTDAAFDASAIEAAKQWRFAPNSSEPGRLYISSLEFEPPQVPIRPKTKDVLPNYPRKLWKNGVTGDVLLMVRVNIPGFPVAVETIHSDDERLTEHAVNAMKKWRFAESNTFVERTRETVAYVRFRFLVTGKVHYIYPAW